MGRGEALEFSFELAQDIGGGGEEFGFVLLAAAESDVVVGVLTGTGVPIGAHAFVDGVSDRALQGTVYWAGVIRGSRSRDGASF